MSAKIYGTVTLSRRETLSSGFERFSFTGPDLLQFPQNCEGGYIKLMFDRAGYALQSLPDGFPDIERDQKPVVRSFTISAFEAVGDLPELSFDVAYNKNSGVAASWICDAQLGDRITIVGPGKKQPLLDGYDWYMVVGDKTSLPAIVVNLEALDHSKPVICVLDAKSSDFWYEDIPNNVEIFFTEDGDSGSLESIVKKEAWREGWGSCYVWAACEFSQMRALRRFFRFEKNIRKEDMYISSYWKQGETDEGNKKAKKLDQEADL